MANLSNINNKFLVTTGGNVGIGNTSPTLSTLTVGIGSTNNPSQICQLAGSGSGVYSVLSLTNTNGVAADNNGVGLDFHVNAAYSATGRIQLIHPTAQSGTTTNSSMQFLTYGTVSGVTTFSPRMTIDYIGNVGIATATPQKKLHIEGTGGASEMQILVSSASDTVGHTAGIGLRGEGGEADGDFRIKGGIFFERIAGSFGNGKMILAVNSSVSNTSVTVADHALTIDTNKNVGIGTTSPGSKLTVSGPSTAASNTPSQAIVDIVGSSTAHLLMGTASASPYGAWINSDATGQPLVLQGPGGNVGIGTASPTYKFEVSNGTITGTFNPNSSGFMFLGSTSNHPLYFGANDSIKMAILSSGNVGIATTAPGSKLTINGQVQVGPDAARRYALQPSQWGYASSYRTLILGSASTSYNINDTGSVTLAFGVDVSGNSSGSFTGDGRELLFRNGAKFTTPNTANNGYHSNILVLNDGNVGIGTTSPQTKLQTNLTITGAYLAYLNGTSATFDAASNIAVVHNSPSIGSATAAGLVLANNDKSDGAPSPIIAFSAKSASNSYNHTYAAIYGIRTAGGADANWTKGDIVLATGSGTGPNERMRITSGGNVGIGTTNPTYGKLQVHTSSATVFSPSVFTNGTNIRLQTGGTAATNVTTGISFGVGGAAEGYIGLVQNSSGYGDLVYQNYNGSAYGERMRIDSSGKVIINDNTIGDKLLLAGDNAGTARGLMFNCSTTTNQGDTWDIDAQSSTGIIKFSTTSTERLRVSSNGTLTSTPVAGAFGIRQNGVSNISNSGYIAGNATLSFTYDVLSQGSMFIECVFNHYGYIANYGCARIATVGVGPVIQINNIQEITSSNGGSWTFTRVSNTRFTIAKTAGTYAGGGYFFVNIRGNGVKYT